MPVQTSEKLARIGKSKAKVGWNKKMQTAKDQDNSGDMTAKIEVKIEADPKDEKPLDTHQFNGHLESSLADLNPKVEDGSANTPLQSQDGSLVPATSLRPPTRNMTPTSHRMMIGPNNQLGGGSLPPNCMAAVAGPRMTAGMPVSLPSGGQMQLAAGGHFVQNQSQVFVFSTEWANSAAEAVQCGQFPSILDFHRSQPSTQQFLQKFPITGPQLGMGMNMRPDGSLRQPSMSDVLPESSGAFANVAQWVQQQNANLQHNSASGMNFDGPPDGLNMQPNGRYGRMMPQWGPSPGPQSMPDLVGLQGYPMCESGQGFMTDMDIAPPNMLHGPMTKEENLTPQQLQQREEKLDKVRKIEQMLFPKRQQFTMNAPIVGQGPVMHGHPNSDVMMMHSSMGVPRPGLTMTPPDGMMGSFPPQLGPSRPFMGPGGLPPDWDNMTPEQREWYKLQQEFYLDKCRKQQMQMGLNLPPGNQNRSHVGFFHPMQQMHRMAGPMSPISPSFSGGPVPSPHCGPMMNPNDPQSIIFAKQAGSEFGAVCPSMGSDQNFDHPGGVPRDSMFAFGDGPMPPGRLAGASEPFSPAEFSHPICQQGAPAKLLSGFGPQKRKRSSTNMSDPDDIYKRLLPAPSPQQFSYMNPLEGQELTITKQLNHAFQEQAGAPPPSSPSTYPPPQKSRPTGSKKKKNQTKVDQKQKSQRTPPAADSFMCPSPAIPTSAPSNTSASFQSAPASSPISQTSASSLSSSLANAAPTPAAVTNRAPSVDSSTMPNSVATTAAPIKSSMTKLTSPCLANLAKGVENMTSQMQPNPFRTVQMQETESDVSDISPADNSTPQMSGQMSMSQTSTTTPNTGGSFGSTNNVLGNMHQLHSNAGCNSSMQQLNPTNPVASPPGSIRSAPHSVPQKQGSNMADPAGLGPCQRHSPPLFPIDDPGLDPGARFGFQGSSVGMSGPSTGPQMYSMGPSSLLANQTGCRSSNAGNMSIGNAKIQIQAQAPNTIQYLPSNPSSTGGHPGDGMSDRFLEFDAKQCGKGGMASYSAIMDGIHGPMLQVSQAEMAHQRQMELQMMHEAVAVAGGNGMHPSQMRLDMPFDAVSGPRGPMHVGPRGPGPSASMHLHGPGSPMLGPGGMMHGPGISGHGMGNPMHGPSSPIMGPSGSVHEQMLGHMMGDVMPAMQGHVKTGIGPNGSGSIVQDFGPMGMGPGGRAGGEMSSMTMSRRPMSSLGMHPNDMMMPGSSPPEFSTHRDIGMMPGCGMMGTELGMMAMGGGGREGMLHMRGPGIRPELVSERSRPNRSRQKVRTAESAETRLRNDAAGGMMVAEPGGGRMGGLNHGVMGMDPMSGVMRSDIGMMGMRSDMVPMGLMSHGDRMGMRPDMSMMLQRGSGMPPDMAMMGPRGGSGGRMTILEDNGIPPDSVGMFGFPPGRRGMMQDSMEMCQPGMMPPGMNPSTMCPPGMKSMVMGSPNAVPPPVAGMGDGGGYGAQYQQFQQQLYTQNRSPPMSPVMIRGGMPGGPPPEMMAGRTPYDMMGSGGPNMAPGPSIGFGQPQPGLGPSGPM